MKIPWSIVGKRWLQKGVVQFREPTCQQLSYASNPWQNLKKPDGIYENPQILDLGIVQTLGKGSPQGTNVATYCLHLT